MAAVERKKINKGAVKKMKQGYGKKEKIACTLIYTPVEVRREVVLTANVVGLCLCMYSYWLFEMSRLIFGPFSSVQLS